MRIGILGDVHSNLEALTAVVERLEDERLDHWVQVGDIVGYGADPVECVQIVRDRCPSVCIGNHDAAVVGLLPTDYFNAYAKAAIDWTRDRLGEHELAYLRDLPLQIVRPEFGFTVVHGSLHMPEQFGYVLSKVEAVDSLRHQTTRLAFVGHSHVPAIYLQKRGAPVHDLDMLYGFEIDGSLAGYERALMNVGSVGQPRDEDPRAAYGIYDTEAGEMHIRRVEYDFVTTQEKIRAAGLPAVLADRLALGV